MVCVADPKAGKNEGYNYERRCKCPINGTVNGYSVNEQKQQEANSKRVDTGRDEDSKRSSKERGKDDGGRRPRP